MALTRRNTLVLLFAVVAAAGVIGGTGAFTSVSADRTVSVSSTGDSGANVQLEVNEVQGLSDAGGDTIGISFDNLNQNATTKYEDAISITPQGSNGPYDVSIANSPTGVDFTVNNGTDTNGGTEVNATATIDLTGSTTASDIPNDANVTISVTQAS